ncbi:M023R [Myxoma virus]|nr:m023 [Myxoma virus]WNN26904.1 M023R [Myxoma virus]
MAPIPSRVAHVAMTRAASVSIAPHSTRNVTDQ